MPRSGVHAELFDGLSQPNGCGAAGEGAADAGAQFTEASGDASPATSQCPDARRRGRHLHPDAAGPLPPLLRPLPGAVRPPGVDSYARRVAERDPARTSPDVTPTVCDW